MSRPEPPARTILLAPDKFKGSLPAAGVVSALERGLLREDPTLVIRSVPVADGGDGTVDAMVTAGFDRIAVEVTGPTGVPVLSSWARNGRVAVVEMADACGLVRLLGAPAPLTASSRGLGDAVRAALDAGVDHIVIGIGGSASTDGGAGFLAALGARLLDQDGQPIPDGGAALAALATIDLSSLHPRLSDITIEVASDVDNPLLGPPGAAAVYGPQKGASPADVVMLDAALGRWADLLAAAVGQDHRDRPGAGAAGGVGLAAQAISAQLRSGIDLVLELVGFEQIAQGVDLVVVGEGSLDHQSLRGKAPVGVARAARSMGIPVIAVSGRRDVDETSLHAAGIAAAYALTDLEPDPTVCVRDTARLLEEIAPRLIGTPFDTVTTSPM